MVKKWEVGWYEDEEANTRLGIFDTKEEAEKFCNMMNEKYPGYDFHIKESLK